MPKAFCDEKIITKKYKKMRKSFEKFIFRNSAPLPPSDCA